MTVGADRQQLPALGPRARVRGIFLMCLVALGCAVIEWLGAKTAGYSPYEVVWMRYGTHLLLLLAVLGPKVRGRLVRTSRPFLQVFRGLLLLVMPVCFVTAVERQLDTDTLWAVTWTSVPMMVGLSIHLLGESVTRGQWLLVGTGLGGTWLVLSPRLPHSGWALGFALGAAFSFGLYVVLARVLRTEYTGANLFFAAAWVFLPLSLCLPWFWHTPAPGVLAMMLGVGVAGLGMLFLLELAVDLAPVSLIAPFIFTECLWEVQLGVAGQGSGLGPRGLAGAILILGSCAWILIRELRAARRAGPVFRH